MKKLYYNALATQKRRPHLFQYGTQEMLVRVVAPDVHLDPDNMIGTLISFEYIEEDNKTYFKMLNRTILPSANMENKPVRIFERTGKRLIFAFANSYKDRQMLKFTAGSKHHKLVLVLDHDSSDEFIHERPKLLKLAKEENWTVVSMKKAFKKIFSFY